MRWKPWQYLLDLIDIIQAYHVIYILKASQLGISWLMAIINDHIMNFAETSKCLLLSQGAVEAQDMLSKISFIHERLSDYMRLPIENNNREYISFKDTPSQVRALPSTEKAGHGFQGTLVTRDEVARHEFARENFRAVARAIDSGGKLVELSTANKEDPTNYFQEKTSEFYYHPDTVKKVFPSGLELYTNPTKPGMCLVFLGWKLRPVRDEGMTLDEWWQSRVLPKYTALEIEEQYPEKIEDIFKTRKSGIYFEEQALNDMGYDTCPSIRQSEYDTFNDVIRYYKLPVQGKRYVVYTDPSDGVGDPFVTGVMDYITGEVIASATGKLKVDKVAQVHDYLSHIYGDATNSWEANSVGIAFANCIKDMKTKNVAPRRNPKGEIVEGMVGTYVEGEMKHYVLIPDLAFAIAHRQIVCHDREFIQQSKMVTRGRNKDNTREVPVTDKKQSFDWVMMMAGLWQMQKYVPRSSYGGFTIDVG